MAKIETARFRAADRYGNHLTVLEHVVVDHTAKDTSSAVKHYRLTNGRPVRRTPSGTFEVIETGTKLWRV